MDAYSLGRAMTRVAPDPLRRALKRGLYRFNGSLQSRIWHMDDRGIVFVQIPKVAMSSVRAALAAFAAGEPEVDLVHARKRVRGLAGRYVREAYPAEVRRLGETCFTFGFVRNPLDRLLSAYTNKRNAQDAVDTAVFRNLGIGLDASFREFVEAVHARNSDDCDAHIRSQHSFLFDRRGLVVHFVGRFETIESDWKILMDRLGLPPLPHRNPSAHGSYADAYTPDLARLAVERYRRDIELFGYSKEVAQLL